MADKPIKDPLGRVIVLHDRTWYGHVIKGHPDVLKYRSLVEDAISSPLEIRRSYCDPDCRLYFGMGPREGVIIMAIVDVALGLLKTAHLARKISGGATEWSRPTR